MIAAFALLFAAVAATPVPGNTGLPGIWRAEGMDLPALRGRVVVTRRADEWVATIGRTTGFASTWASTIAFPNGQGTLRFTVAGDTLTGLWIQPGSTIDSNAYATPLYFRSEGKNRWVGTLRPYVPRYKLFIEFTRNADGSLGGFLRDPIGNVGTIASFDRVTVNGSKLDIISRTHHYNGALSSSPDVITVAIATDTPLIFHRVTDADTVGFYPRETPEQDLRRPSKANDGWATATLADEHIEEGGVTKIVHRLASTVPVSSRTPFVQGLLIARNGKLVLDQYFFGFDRETPHDVRSAGKSLDAALFGIALSTNPRLTVDSPAYRWLPYPSFAHPDPRKSRITVADFFDMKSGLACDDNDDDSPGNEGTMQSQTTQSDWYRYVMDLPLVRDPGSEPAVYCSGGLNVLGGIIVGATRGWTPRLFEDRLARPLEFGEYHLQLTPKGEMYMGGGSYFLPRDFLKLGQLFLQDGSWDGHRIFSPQWGRDAVAPHSGLTTPGDYGYSWHRTSYVVAGTTLRAFEAQGNGGQYLIVVPERQLVIEITAANYGDYRTWQTFHDSIAQPIVAACG